MDPAIISRIATDVALPEDVVAATVDLFEKGSTAPFIARYRREITGGIDPAKVCGILERMTYYREVLDRRASLLKLLNDQAKLTDELKSRIEACFSRVDIEDLIYQFRPRRKTRAAEARDKGLEPLSEYLWNQDADAWSLEEHIDVFVDPAKNVTTREEALQGAADIIAEWIAENIEHRKKLREMLWETGQVISTVVPAKAGQKTKYNMYYDHREPVTSIPSHRVLAIRRGSKEGVLTSSIEGDGAKALDYLLGSVIKDKESRFSPILEAATKDAYNRILRPLIETEVRSMLKERADREAVRVFQENLANLLFSPPAGQIVVLGVDAGKGNECTLAVVGRDGNLAEFAAIAPMPTMADLEGAKTVIRDLVTKHGIEAVAFGSGPSARELETIFRQIAADEKMENLMIVSVNDSGLAIYSSSRAAREEFPEASVAARCAASLARRLQDPLAELVKIDPKLIGVGQYQHDVDQKELHRSLVQTVQSCVNTVGVDLNTATHWLLRYVAGMSDKLARKTVAFRGTKGTFSSRAALLGVPGVDAGSYQQAAGFLRVRGGEMILDGTAIHPESYAIVDKIAQAVNLPVADLLGNKEVISALRLEDFVADSFGMPTLQDIREELLKPGRDPRRAFSAPKYRADIKNLADLKEGMALEGTVTNVTNFGAFVDIGVHQDGLVHLSQMSSRFIRDPREAVKVGDIVQVKVISVEVETKRIGLSIKALLPAPIRRRKRPRRQPVPATAPAAQAAEGENQAAAPEPGADPQKPVERFRDRAPGRVEFRRPPQQDRGRRRPPPNDPRRQERPGERSAERPPRPEAPPEKPALPEKTMQEKIAILQSKFRGIS
jgi:uncharacterized protein